MLAHVTSPLTPFPSSDWYNITLDESCTSVSSSTSSSLSRSSADELSPLRGLAQRRQQHKLASGDFLAPLTPLTSHLYPRTPFCSPNSSPYPLDDASFVSSPLSASVSGSGSLLTPSRKKQSQPHYHHHQHQYHQQQQSTTTPLQHLTSHTASWFSSSSSSLSPHSARSHSVPFLPFRYFDDVDCDLPLSPDSALSFPHYCTPFPSPIQPIRPQAADLAPPSPLLLTRPSSPQLPSASLSSSSSLSAFSPLVDFSSSLVVPPSLSNQPPLSPAVVPLTPPSSPLPVSLLSPLASSASSHSSSLFLSIPSLY